MRVVIVEASENLLGAFDSSLQSYVKRKLETRRIEVMTCSAVRQVCAESVLLDQKKVVEGSEELATSTFTLPFGICVWATGNQALDFVKSLGIASLTAGPGRGRILIDDHLRIVDESIPSHREIFALGDCAADKEKPLGLLAQVGWCVFIFVFQLSTTDASITTHMPPNASFPFAGRQSAGEILGLVFEQRSPQISSLPLHLHGIHGTARDVGRRLGRSQQRRRHAPIIRLNGLHGVAVGLLDLLRLHHQQDPDSHVLVQSFFLRKRHLQVLTVPKLDLGYGLRKRDSGVN